MADTDFFTYAKLAPYAPPEMWLADHDKALIYALQKSGLANGQDYLERYPDVKAAGLDPYEHFIRYGRNEKRILNLYANSSCNGFFRHGTVETLYGDALTVQWIMTAMCNYDCSYCFYHEKIDKRKFTPFDTMKRVVDTLHSLNRSLYKINLIGGEPTIYPQLPELIDYLRISLGPRLGAVNIISNGSNRPDLYDKIFSLADQINLNMCISLHFDYLNKDHILNMIDRFANKISLNFNFMFNPARRDEMREFIPVLFEKRKTHPFIMSFSLLMSGEKFDVVDPRYTEEDLKWRDQISRDWGKVFGQSNAKWRSRSRGSETQFWDHELNGQRNYEGNVWGLDRTQMIDKGFYTFTGMWCVPGTSVLAIHPGGECIGNLCSFKLGAPNIFHGNPFLLDDFYKPVKCSHATCLCCVNDLLQKFSSRAEAEAFSRQFRERQRRLIYDF